MNAKMALRFCSFVVSFPKIRDDRFLDSQTIIIALARGRRLGGTLSADGPREPGIYGPPSRPCQSGREGQAADMCKLSAGTRPSDTD